MVLKFGEWLLHQQYREDLIGDLACVLCTKNTDDRPQRSGHDEHKIWVDIVIGIIEPGYITVFNEAWQEFLLAKQDMIGSLD
ncbi:MAG: hypothetical protein ACK2U0_06955 [Candidatus Promineifilaceae bacterium]|jgi:hypothetical protein